MSVAEKELILVGLRIAGKKPLANFNIPKSVAPVRASGITSITYIVLTEKF